MVGGIVSPSVASAMAGRIAVMEVTKLKITVKLMVAVVPTNFPVIKETLVINHTTNVTLFMIAVTVVMKLAVHAIKDNMRVTR